MLAGIATRGPQEKMLDFDTALSRVLAGVPRLNDELADTTDLLRRVLRTPLVSEIDLPVADNSSMDGYAVRSEDLVDAHSSNPVSLKLIGTVPAGEITETTVEQGTCIRLFTGSFLPPGADAVLMQEDTERDAGGGNVLCLDRAKPWENIRFKGEDVKRGTTVITNGTRMRARHLGVIAALGQSSCRVSRRPRVGIVATGHELQEAGKPLAPGGIYESNRLILAELVRQVGGLPTVYPLVEDTLDATREALSKAAQENDVVITSGGVSVGDYDLIRPAIESLGGEIDFWRVRLRPGKPFVFARLDGKPLFGLPGNPVSAVTTYMVLVRPALLAMQGATETGPTRRNCQLRESIANRGDRPHFYRVQLDDSEGVTSAGLQGSHALQSLSLADGWLCVEPGQERGPGDVVSVMVWDD